MELSGAKATSPMAPLVARLNSFTPLSADETVFIQGLRGRGQVYPAQSLLHENVAVSAKPLLVVSGWAARVRWLSDGRRQILSVLLPGDLLAGGVDSRPLVRSMVMAMSEVRALDASTLYSTNLSLLGTSVLLANLAEAERSEDVRLLDQVVRLGRQRALERVAHWLLEIEHRLRTAGLSEDGVFNMPLTQELLGDTLGLSIVHVNRTIRELRTQQMLTLNAGRAEILDFGRMRALADFEAPVRPAPAPLGGVRRSVLAERVRRRLE